MVECLHQLGEQRGPLDHSLGMNPAIPGKAIGVLQSSKANMGSDWEEICN